MQNHINDKTKRDKLIVDIKKLIEQKFPNEVKNLDLNDEHIAKVLDTLKCRLSYISDLVGMDFSFLWVLPDLKTISTPTNFDANKLIDELQKIDFNNKEIIFETLKQFSKTNNIKFNEFMLTLRALLSGLPKGPKIAEMMEMLGKDSTLERIRRINSIFKSKKK